MIQVTMFYNLQLTEPISISQTQNGLTSYTESLKTVTCFDFKLSHHQVVKHMDTYWFSVHLAQLDKTSFCLQRYFN
jgi:hypothetical protein